MNQSDYFGRPTPAVSASPAAISSPLFALFNSVQQPQQQPVSMTSTGFLSAPHQPTSTTGGQSSHPNVLLNSLLSGTWFSQNQALFADHVAQQQRQSYAAQQQFYPRDIAQSILASMGEQVVPETADIEALNNGCYQSDTVYNPPPPPQPEPEASDLDIDISDLQIPAELLDDLASRFVLNMPPEEKDDPIRICFQIEVAFWFYVDFYCETIANLPKMKLKKFAYIMFTYIPRLRKFLDVFDQVITSWIDYKFSIPTSGAVLLDKSLEYVLLVQGYGSKNWSFPKGKVNHDETLMNCAIREVLEETGYDCSGHIYENIFLERKIFESACRLFIVTDVEMDHHFAPHVRNEIRSIQWFSVADLPMRPQKKTGFNGGGQTSAAMASKFFTVYPFVYSIRKWIEKERKRRRKAARWERKRTNTGSSSNGDGDGTTTAGSSGEDHNSSSNSPYTVVECPNESTSFVDVKLDDLLNGSSRSGDQSLAGFAVFNADLEGPREESVVNQQSNWPTTWQTLVNEYNRQNCINTPIGYDLMAAPRPSVSESLLQHQHRASILSPLDNSIAANGNSSAFIKLEDLERPPGGGPPVPSQTENGALHHLLGSKQLTCDDKLNFLFSFAASKQEEAEEQQRTRPSSVMDSVAFTTSSTSHPYPNQSIYAPSKPSPFGAIGSKHSGSGSHGSTASPAPGFYATAVNNNTTHPPPAETPPGPNGHFSLFASYSSYYPQQQQQQQQQASPKRDPTPSPPTPPPEPLNPAHYNGCDTKIIPKVQAKIRLLIERLKFVN